MKPYLVFLILGMFALAGVTNAGVVATKIAQDVEHGESPKQIKQNAQNTIAADKNNIHEQVENKIEQHGGDPLVSVDESDE